MALVKRASLKLRPRLLTALNLLPAQQSELATDSFDGLQIVAAKVGDSLEVWGQLPQQPHHFEIDFRFPLQHPGRAHSIQIAVKIKPQKVARIVSRPSGLRRLRAKKTQPGQ